MQKKIKNKFGRLGLLMLLAVSLAWPGLAVADNSASLNQSYNAGPAVLPGMLVETRTQDPTTVVPLAKKDISRLLGVVVPVNDTPIVLTPTTISSRQVIVASTGRYDVLVSNENGSISSGDYLSISSLAGVATKATATQSEIVGQADAAFNGKNNVIGSESLKDTSGKTINVAISSLLVNVRLAPNPLFQKNQNNLPGFLTKTANSLAGKPVSAARLYISVVLLGVTLFIFGSMIYGGVRSGIVSIGRNPLARKSIARGLFQTIVAGLIVFVVGVLAVYLILRF